MSSGCQLKGKSESSRCNTSVFLNRCHSMVQVQNSDTETHFYNFPKCILPQYLERLPKQRHWVQSSEGCSSSFRRCNAAIFAA